MKALIGAALIAAAGILGYLGFQEFQASSKSVSIGTVDLKASNKEKKEHSYLMLGGAGILFLVGIYVFKKK